MAKRSIKIDPIDAFRIAAILKTAKPRQKALRELLTSVQKNFMAALADEDAKETIEDAVKDAITETVNFPPPVSNEQSLDNMGYTDPTYTKLASKLTNIVRVHNASERVLRSEVKAAETVGGCVDMVIEKAGV